MQELGFLLHSCAGASYSGLAGRLILTPLLFVSLSLLHRTDAVCREVIVHHQLSEWEDGDPQRDADGVKNGIVVWKSGAVHVVNGSYSVEPGYGQTQMTLIGEPGAIIKMAGEFIVDQNGKLISWKSPVYGAHIDSRSTAAIKFDGVTITAIEDDVGDDTNQDGAKTSPHQWGVICMSGNDKDVIQNCTIKYCGKLGGFGSSVLANNHFTDFGYIESSSTFPGNSGEVVFNAVPVITGNTFEFHDIGRLDLTGLSPVIENNTIRGASTAILVGPRFLYGSYSDEPSGPTSGTTVITGNTIENCDVGIMVYDSPYFPDLLAARTPPFSLTIRNNRLRGKGTGTAISVGFSNKAEIAYNEIDNFANPIVVQHDYRYGQFTGTAFNGLVINHNKMTHSAGYGAIDSISYKYWSRGIFVDARYNYWGDPTGPEDRSDKDGLYNPFGKGVKAGNGIEYRNFIGAATEVMPDAITISAASDPPAPLAPKSGVTFQVTIKEYQLTSFQTGKITVTLKDETGMILNGSGTVLEVIRDGHSAAVPPIRITIPEYAGQIRIEASLAPDGDNAVTVFSNPVVFSVDQPKSAFQLTAITEASTGRHPALLRGTKATLRFEFAYILSGTGNGRFDIALKDRVSGTGKTLQEYPSSTLGIKPGSNQKASIDLEVLLGSHSIDMKEGEQNELQYVITMKDDQGKTIGNLNGVLPVRALKNYVHIFQAGPKVQKGNQVVSLSSTYYPAGEVPAIWVSISYQIETPDVTNWQIQVGPLDAVDNYGKIIYSYPPSTVHWKGLATTGSMPNELFPSTLVMQPGAPAIPAGTSKMRVHVNLIDPNTNSVVYTEQWYEIPVRNVSQSVEKDIASGAGRVSFDQIPVTLTFASNASAGRAAAHEFNAPYNASARATSVAMGTSGGFTSLNRYWSVYDTLKDGTFSAQISIAFDPARDFPSAAVKEDSLVMTAMNPNTGHLEALPSKLDKSTHTMTADYSRFYELYVIAAKTSSLTGVSGMNAVPGHFSLLQNYPNPFNPSTVIRYTIAELAHVRLRLYDVVGRERAILVDQNQGAGEYGIHFNASSLPSGVYIVTMEAGRFRESKKLLLLK